MTTDYDTPRNTGLELPGSLAELKGLQDASTTAVDLDTDESVQPLDLPGADLASEELTMPVVPKQEDEFVCSRCFLVNHHTHLAGEDADGMICGDCDS